MAKSNVVPFVMPQRDNDAALQRVHQALTVRLEQLPPLRPTAFEACVAHLVSGPRQLLDLPFGQRRLMALRDAFFVAAGREVEMRRLWRESIATACNSVAMARVLGLDEPCVAAAALLYRVADVWLLTALADAEALTNERLRSAALRDILTARSRQLAPRIVRAWALTPAVSQPLLGWRDCGETSRGGLPPTLPARLIHIGSLLASEQLYEGYCTPGVVDAAAQELGLDAEVLMTARDATTHIRALLANIV
jgi:hypothetical protein